LVHVLPLRKLLRTGFGTFTKTGTFTGTGTCTDTGIFTEFGIGTYTGTGNCRYRYKYRYRNTGKKFGRKKYQYRNTGQPMAPNSHPWPSPWQKIKDFFPLQLIPGSWALAQKFSAVRAVNLCADALQLENILLDQIYPK
jgi:hypothetical protein